MRIATIVGERITEDRVALLAGAVELSKSARIKEMFEGGMDVKEISTVLGIRYNHAYNVIQNHVIVNGIEVEKKTRATSVKRVEIEALLLDGKTNMEVARTMRITYNAVWKVRNDLIKAGALEEEKPKIKVTITEEADKTVVEKKTTKKTKGDK
jgi:hypothetical protein